MAVETLMFKLEGLRQASQVSALSGKTFTVGKVTAAGNTAGNGIFKWLFLVPKGEAAGSTVALKIEGGRQAAQLAGLAGKTVTIAPSPVVVGGTSKWLVLNSGTGAATAAKAAAVGAGGVAAKGAVGSSMVLMQLEGVQQAAQVNAMAGQTFTVIQSPVVGGTAKGWLFMKPTAAAAGKDIVALQVQNGTAANLSGMVGKSFTLSKAPLASGNVTGTWIVMQPATGAAAKGVAGAALVGKSAGVGAAKATATTKGAAGLMGLEELGGLTEKTVTKTAIAPTALKGGSVASKPAAAKALAGSSGGGSVTAVAAKSGTIWSGSGMSLGLGWGLGAWGPVLLAGLVAAVGYGAYQYYSNRRELEEEDALLEA